MFAVQSSEMRRKISISAIGIAIVNTFVLLSIPHHHHHDVACVIREYCPEDHTYNDEHTAHHDDGSSADCLLCTGGLQYVKRSSDFQRASNNRHLLPVLWFADIVELSDIHPLHETIGKGYVITYQPPIAHNLHPLRAPPATLI